MGKDRSNRTTVIRILQTNKGVSVIEISSERMFTIVEMKLIAAKIEDAPAKCREKMARSTLAPE
jgi:hypothetical protein